MSEYTPKQWEINNMVTAKKIKDLEEGEGHGSVTVDSALSDTSENPVQNKVITAALADKMNADEIPEATASNNGKILGVENGAYALIPPALNIEGTMSGGNFTITNVTAAQINAAYMAHRPVYIDLPAMHARVYMHICEYTDDSSYKITFCNTQITSDGIVVIQATFNDSTTGIVDVRTAAAT